MSIRGGAVRTSSTPRLSCDSSICSCSVLGPSPQSILSLTLLHHWHSVHSSGFFVRLRWWHFWSKCKTVDDGPLKNFNFRGSGLHHHLTVTEIIHPANNPKRNMAHAIISNKGVSSDESGSGSVRLPLACCTCSHPTRIARACPTCSLLGPAVLARTLATCWIFVSFSSMSLNPAFCTSS